MIFLPDTDTINFLLKGIGPARERLKAAATAGDTLMLSPVVHYEVTRYLRLKEANRLLRLYDTLITDWRRPDFTAADWDRAASLWAGRHSIGRPITDSDLLIAVTARSSGAVLVTNNERHFEHLGLSIENWAK